MDQVRLSHVKPFRTSEQFPHTQFDRNTRGMTCTAQWRDRFDRSPRYTRPRI